MKDRNLAVGHGLLGQIVVDDEGVLAVVAEELSHRTARVRRQVLQGSSVGGRGSHDDSVIDGT